jgi:hypothetical protein
MLGKTEEPLRFLPGQCSLHKIRYQTGKAQRFPGFFMAFFRFRIVFPPLAVYGKEQNTLSRFQESHP